MADIPAIVEGTTLTRFLRLIRFSHTIFALPFALGALWSRQMVGLRSELFRW